MAFKGLLLIWLSIALTSGSFLDLFPTNGSCPVIWTAKVGGVDSLGVSVDGSFVSVGSISPPGPSGNGTVSVFARNSSRPLWTYATGFTQVGPVTVSMSNDGSYLSTGGDVRYLRSVAVFGRAKGVPIWTLNTPYDVFASSAWLGAYATSVVSGDGDHVAVHALLPVQGGVQDSIAIFRRLGAVPLWFYNTTRGSYPGPGPASTSLSYEGAYLATIVPDNGVLYLFSQHDNRTLWTQRGPWFSLRMSETGDYVAAANNTRINIFGKDSNSTLLSIAFPILYLSDLSRDGSTVAVITGSSGDIDATLRLYDRLSGRELFHANPITADSYQQISGLAKASVSGDGSKTAVVTASGGLFVYDRSGGLICSARQGSGDTIVAISADGRNVVTGNSQLTYMAVAYSSQVPLILYMVAGAATAVAVGFFIFRRRRLRKGVGAPKESV